MKLGLGFTDSLNSIFRTGSETKSEIEIKAFELEKKIENLKLYGSDYDKAYNLPSLEAQLNCIIQNNYTSICGGSLVEPATIRQKAMKEAGYTNLAEFENAYNEKSTKEKNKYFIIGSIGLVTILAATGIYFYTKEE